MSDKRDMFDGLNNQDFDDQSNFQMIDDSNYDIIEDYNDMMQNVEEETFMDSLTEYSDSMQEINFYETVDELEFEWDDQITDQIANEGKRSYRNKENKNKYEEEFSKELSMYYELLEEINNFSKKLDKKFDAIDKSKAKGTSKYFNDLIASIINVKSSKLSTIKEISNLKKVITELTLKDAKVSSGDDDGSLESVANQYFKNIMGVGRSNFINMLNNGGSEDSSSASYYDDTVDDITYMENMQEYATDMQNKISDRLMSEGSSRSIEGDKYITYENQNIDIIIKYSISDNDWEPIAVDENMQQVLDFPVPTRKQLGKVKFSADKRYMTDQFGRSYKVIEKYESQR